MPILSDTKNRDAILSLSIEESNMPVVICRAAADNPIIYANKAYTVLSGYNLKDIVGRNPRFMHGPFRNQPGLDTLRQALRNQTGCETLIQNYTRNGTSYWCELCLTPVHDDGVVTHWISVQKDVTDKILLEHQKKDLVALLAHDIKNPLLASNMILAAILEGRSGDLPTEDLLSKVRTSNDELLQLLWNIIDLYNTESTEFTIHRESLSIKTLVSNSITTLSHLAGAKNVEILVELDDMNGIAGDATLLGRVFQNLIHNALKNTPEGGRIRIFGTTTETTVNVKIQDSGPGIPESKINKLFTRFSDVSQRMSGESSGLGLYLSKLIVDMHHGKLSAANNEIGALFSLEIPIER